MEADSVLQLIKAWQVHSIQAHGRIFMEPWGCLTCLYSKVHDPCTLRVPLHVSAWHTACQLSPCMAYVMALASLRGIPQGAPSPSSILKLEKKPKSYRTEWFCSCNPTSCYGNLLSDPVWRLWEHYLAGSFKVMGELLPLVTQILGWGSQTASIYPTEGIMVYARGWGIGAMWELLVKGHNILVMQDE